MHRWRRTVRVLFAAVALWLARAPAAAVAETHRLAVVVGSNAGNGDRPALRFAETDAGKVARVLVDLGGVAEPDVLLLQGRSVADVRVAFDEARLRVARWRHEPDTRVL